MAVPGVFSYLLYMESLLFFCNKQLGAYLAHRGVFVAPIAYGACWRLHIPALTFCDPELWLSTTSDPSWPGEVSVVDVCVLSVYTALSQEL